MSELDLVFARESANAHIYFLIEKCSILSRNAVQALVKLGNQLDNLSLESIVK